MKKSMLALAVLAGFAAGPRPAYADDIAFQFANGHNIVVPFRQVSFTELYSLREGKGFPAVESVLFLSARKKFQGTFGAAAELGVSKAVPFLGANWRLTERLFDTSNNLLYFGFAAAKRFDQDPRNKSWRGVEITLKASHPLF